MRTSTTIVGQMERLLLLPGWRYVPWHFTPYFRRHPASGREDGR
jgi:hypothetical protein